MEDRLLTICQVSQYLQITPVTAYRLVKTGKLPYYRIGRQIRVKMSDLERFRKNAAPGA